MGKINKVFGISLDLDPKICLLGCMEKDKNMRGRQTAIIRCLFLARKLIARTWLALNPPTRVEWEDEFNKTIRKGRFVYNKRENAKMLKKNMGMLD